MSVIFFTLSLMSKATFSLMPLFIVFVSVTGCLRLTKKTNYWIFVFVGIGLFSSLFQSWFYSHVTQTQFTYELSQRILTSAAAFSKMWGSIFFNHLNVLDIDNWGSWLQHNHLLIFPGLILTGIGLAYLTSTLLRKNFRAALPLIGFILVYLPISGVVFPHRNFFSVRYFDPALLTLLVIFLGTQDLHTLMSKVGLKSIYLGYLILITFFLVETQSESKLWLSSRTVYEKSLADQPESTIIQSQVLAQLLTESTKGTKDPQVKIKISAFQQSLHRECEELTEYKSECALYYMAAYLLTPRSLEKTYENRLNHVERAAADITSDLKYSLTVQLLEVLKNGTPLKSDLAESWRDKSLYQTGSTSRILYWITECLTLKRESAQARLMDYYNSYLLYPNQLEAFISAHVHSRYKGDLENCKVHYPSL